MFKDGKYYITLKDVECEVSKEVHEVFYQGERHDKYLVEKDQAHNVVLLNISGLEADSDQEAFSSPEPSHEEMMIAREIHDTLHKCIDLLPESERALIQAIYFDGDTDKAYGNKQGVTQQAINKQRKKILEKLRIFMDKLGSFPDLVVFFL